MSKYSLPHIVASQNLYLNKHVVVDSFNILFLHVMSFNKRIKNSMYSDLIPSWHKYQLYIWKEETVCGKFKHIFYSIHSSGNFIIMHAEIQCIKQIGMFAGGMVFFTKASTLIQWPNNFL